MNISPQQYQYQDDAKYSDYFRGCKTILSSEIAALKKAEEIYKNCEQNNTRWFDKDFGPITKAVPNIESQSETYKRECAMACFGTTDTEKVEDIIWQTP